MGIGDNSTRAKVADRFTAYSFGKAIHPSAIIGREVEIGEGTVIMAGAIINPGCRIGRHCVVNTGASLDHDSVMEDFSHMAPGVHTGGNCRIGKYAFIGIGATLVQGVVLGEGVFIKAGEVVK